MGRQRSASGAPEKNNGGGGLLVADGQAVSAQIAEIQWAVGGPLVVSWPEVAKDGLVIT